MQEGYVPLLPYANDRENTQACDGRHTRGCSRSRDLVLPRTSFCSLKSKCRHDRSCLEMSEADGVDGGAICKRGFIHLQFAEKLEAPEAERHLGSRILEVPVSSWVPRYSNLHVVGPGSVILVDTSKFYGIQVLSSKWLYASTNFPKSFLFR
ncbi:LOW QUALITY PROTEIN: hypothetical protein V1477_005867 [Vespula maculifrons]|uniref:Uncharacterized protein n=1 Tax=Vespula maculifrons TaxID=7453 RepID=A0ABD2CMM3_VESMC